MESYDEGRNIIWERASKAHNYKLSAEQEQYLVDRGLIIRCWICGAYHLGNDSEWEEVESYLGVN